MKNTWVIVGIAAVLIIAGIFIFKSKTNTPVDQVDQQTKGEINTAPTTATTGNVTPPASTTTTGGVVTSATEKTFTLADVATHNNQSSCYTAINGTVYDLTSWISRHPGGAREILSICGKDGSAAFNGQHGGQGKPAFMLSGFEIGILAK